jgi:hypothetical protein
MQIQTSDKRELKKTYCAHLTKWDKEMMMIMVMGTKIGNFL